MAFNLKDVYYSINCSLYISPLNLPTGTCVDEYNRGHSKKSLHTSLVAHGSGQSLSWFP